jgi:predicted site-specific integrase-resolvase
VVTLTELLVVVIVDLTEWAESEGIARVTASAYRWFREGKPLVAPRRVGGLILVDPPAAGTMVVYARVSSADLKPDVDRRAGRSGCHRGGLCAQ